MCLYRYGIVDKGRSPGRPATPSRRSLDMSVNQESEELPQKSSIQVGFCLFVCVGVLRPSQQLGHVEPVS